MKVKDQSATPRRRVSVHIDRELEAAKATGLEGLKHYRNAGIMFHELKRQRPNSFDAFCRGRFKISHEWRAQMMRLAENWDAIMRVRKSLAQEGRLTHSHDTLRGANGLVPTKRSRTVSGDKGADANAISPRAYEEIEVCAFEKRLSSAEKKRLVALCSSFSNVADDAARQVVARKIKKIAIANCYRVRRLLEVAGCDAQGAKTLYAAVRASAAKVRKRASV